MLKKPHYLKWLALLAGLLLLAGMLTPLLTLTRLWMFDEQISILTGILKLWQQGQYLLFVIILGFSVVLPLAKLALLARLLSVHDRVGAGTRRLLHLMHEYGRWAMLDVMVVAMLIVTVKLGVIVSVEVHYGLYLFAAGVLLTMLVTRQTVHWLESAER
ncbi:Paraquat-inducible protein A [Marinobacterium lacunae]|uniref:Paraquat-inducible protein A n=1 Tax=Marinobacterium lacunae TaxID=1232683 RepID=A0A081FUB4_9GAMM|nr:paraquat-inducible protein A [Marinobacterium lacunae]KEA62119.1 Paraquat-inducible protein A [Marinobacterium lacunae]MBR9883613.1 paraquat-inducible protein A [Oceanospirillales bacterium]